MRRGISRDYKRDFCKSYFFCLKYGWRNEKWRINYYQLFTSQLFPDYLDTYNVSILSKKKSESDLALGKYCTDF